LDNKPPLYVPEQARKLVGRFGFNARRKIIISHENWKLMGELIFKTSDMNKWKFICPSCGYIASVKDYRDALIPSTFIAEYCIGNWIGVRGDVNQWGQGPCGFKGDYETNPVHVTDRLAADDYVFHFAANMKYVEGPNHQQPVHMEDEDEIS